MNTINKIIRRNPLFVLLAFFVLLSGCSSIPPSGGRAERGLEGVFRTPKNVIESWRDSQADFGEEISVQDPSVLPKAQPATWTGFKPQRVNWRKGTFQSIIRLHDGYVAIREYKEQEFLNQGTLLYDQWGRPFVIPNQDWVTMVRSVEVWIPRTSTWVTVSSETRDSLYDGLNKPTHRDLQL